MNSAAALSDQFAAPVAVVTGATGAIGKAVVRRLLARDVHVVAHSTSDSNIGSLMEALSVESGAPLRCTPMVTDLADADQIDQMFTAVADAFGRVDVLVNNAGVSGPYGGFESATAADLQHVFAVNSIAPMLCAQHAVRLMPEAGGTIVNVSTKAAVLGSANEWVHYAASKGALETFTTGLAGELAPRNIRVNAVRPGLMTNNFGTAPDGRNERLVAGIPMQRAGTPDEMAATIEWLALDAPTYVTGTFIDATGGR